MKAVDLFSGLGGFSLGAVMAGCTVLWAGNHWQEAVDTHARNHPDTVHACQDHRQANWLEVPRADILLASPACQGHSPARGKDRPHHDAQRATAWAVLDYIEVHRPDAVVVENVPEFLRWQLLPAWTQGLQALGYAVSPHVSDAADHGVPQNRRRAWVVCTRSRAPLVLQLPRREHVPAATFIDFTAGSWSPVDRPGRAPATLQRIAAGRAALGDRFLAPYYGSGSGRTGRSLQRPIATITTRDRWAVVDGDRMRMMLPTEGRAGMGFPASYAIPEDPRLAMHMLGNAVCPVQACDVIRMVREAL